MIKRWLKGFVSKHPRLELATYVVRRRLSAIRNRAGAEGVYQLSGTTAYDRRPWIFEGVREIIGSQPVEKVLSFGCSTGEEAFSLRSYFRDARIFGTDIDRKRLKAAAASNARYSGLEREHVTFFFSNEENMRRYGPFDAIFALAVFICHPEDTLTDNLSKIYPFRVFEEGLSVLVENVRVGGLLVLYNTNYRVMDTKWRDYLEVVKQSKVIQSHHVPLFRPDGTKDPIEGYDEQVFRRVR